jgi:hypothetical protein
MSEVKDLEKIIKIQKDQIAKLSYYLAGSGAIQIDVPHVQKNEKIICPKEHIHAIAASKIKNGEACLDIGCGLRPQRLSLHSNTVYVEPYSEYRQRLREASPQKIIIRSNAIDALSMFEDGSFNVIYLMDVLEHMEKEEGFLVINEALRVTNNQVVIFTPLGFMPQLHTDLGDVWDGATFNELQDHKSGWLPEEFPDSITIVSNDYHNNQNGAFYAILFKPNDGQLSTNTIRFFAEKPEHRLIASLNDLHICDIRFSPSSWEINRVPKENGLYLPFDQIIANYDKDVSWLESVIVNYRTTRQTLRSLKEFDVKFDSEKARIVYNSLIRGL